MWLAGCIGAALLGGVLLVGFLLVSAIAMPDLMRARMAANEADVATAMRSISEAQNQFQQAEAVDLNADGIGDYGTLQELASHVGPDGTPLIDSELASGTKAGYSFEVTVERDVAGTAPEYTCVAKPLVPGRTGFRQYYVDESNVIRVTADGTDVGETSTPLN